MDAADQVRIMFMEERIARLEKMVLAHEEVIHNLKGLTIARPTYTPPQKAGFLSGLFK